MRIENWAPEFDPRMPLDPALKAEATKAESNSNDHGKARRPEHEIWIQQTGTVVRQLQRWIQCARFIHLSPANDSFVQANDFLVAMSSVFLREVGAERHFTSNSEVRAHTKLFNIEP